MQERNAEDKWELPDINDVPGLVSIVCRGSPKLRATLRIIADLVILYRKKVDHMVLPPCQPATTFCLFLSPTSATGLLYI